MRKTLLRTILILGSLIVGYLIGNFKGEHGANGDNQNKSVERLKIELKQKEELQIRTLLKGNAYIETKNEGHLLKRKNVQYLVGSIKNNALIASAKDVKVQVSLLSKTKSEIKSVEFTLYEYILPGKSQSFKKKIDISENVADFKWTIIDAKAQNNNQ